MDKDPLPVKKDMFWKEVIDVILFKNTRSTRTWRCDGRHEGRHDGYHDGRGDDV